MKRGVGTISLFALGVNGIVGVGIFFTPNAIASLVPGSSGMLVYLATAALLLPVALTMARLGRELSVDGGPYVWARAAFGQAPAFVVGWLSAVSALFSTAAVISGLAEHLGAALLVPAGTARLLFLWLLLLVLAAVAASGLGPSALTWDALTAIKLLPLLILVGLSLGASAVSSPMIPQHPTDGFRRALLIAVFPLQGFEIVPVLAGSSRQTRWGVPLATVSSLLFAALLYTAIQRACTRALPDLAVQTAPLPAAALAFGGPALGRLVAVGTNLSALGTAFAMVVMTPRYLAALGSDAGLGARLDQRDRRDVPWLSLWLSVGLVGIVASWRALASLLVLSSAAVLIQYLSAMASLARLSLDPARALSRAWLLVIALGCVALLLLAQAVEPAELVILVFLLAIGVILAVLGRRQTRPRT